MGITYYFYMYLAEAEVEDIIIHEMIHYYIGTTR